MVSMFSTLAFGMFGEVFFYFESGPFYSNELVGTLLGIWSGSLTVRP